MGSIPPTMKPKHNLLAAHPTVRTDLFERINTGTITPHRASISRFTENGIELTDGEVIEPLDAIIACTGYQVTSCLPLYSLFFIFFIRLTLAVEIPFLSKGIISVGRRRRELGESF